MVFLTIILSGYKHGEWGRQLYDPGLGIPVGGPQPGRAARSDFGIVPTQTLGLECGVVDGYDQAHLQREKVRINIKINEILLFLIFG